MSTAIRHMHYKPDSQELSVWFGPDFRRYKYFGVPQHLYEAFSEADSQGQFFNRFIKGRFDALRSSNPPIPTGPGNRTAPPHPLLRPYPNNSRSP